MNDPLPTLLINNYPVVFWLLNIGCALVCVLLVVRHLRQQPTLSARWRRARRFVIASGAAAVLLMLVFSGLAQGVVGAAGVAWQALVPYFAPLALMGALALCLRPRD